MDPYSSPYIILNDSPYNPFPHSVLSTREFFWVKEHARVLGNCT